MQKNATQKHGVKSVPGATTVRPGEAPLVRVRLLRLSAAEHVLIAGALHHIVSDGWSMGVFVKEVVALYKAYLEGELLRCRS